MLFLTVDNTTNRSMIRLIRKNACKLLFRELPRNAIALVSKNWRRPAWIVSHTRAILLPLLNLGPAGKPLVVVPQEYPRGLQQLGNTCYLNSLLQYFYTIKELREVIESGRFDLDMPISDEDLLKHRIGGRLVSRREVERSKKCAYVRLTYA